MRSVKARSAHTPGFTATEPVHRGASASRFKEVQVVMVEVIIGCFRPGEKRTCLRKIGKFRHLILTSDASLSRRLTLRISVFKVLNCNNEFDLVI